MGKPKASLKDFAASKKCADPQVSPPSVYRQAGRRLKLTFRETAEKGRPCLEKAEFRWLDSEFTGWVSFERGNRKSPLTWWKVADALSLCILDYVCWWLGRRSETFFFRGARKRSLAATLAEAFSSHYKGIRKLFSEFTIRGKTSAGISGTYSCKISSIFFGDNLAGKSPNKSLGRSITITDFLPADCIEIFSMDGGDNPIVTQLNSFDDILNMANRIRSALDLPLLDRAYFLPIEAVGEMKDAAPQTEKSQPPPRAFSWPEYLRSSSAAQQALKQYPDKYIERHGRIKVLWMSKPVLLKETFVEAQLVDPSFLRTYACLATVEQTYRAEGRGTISTSEHLPADAYAWANEWQLLNILGQPGSGKSTLLRRLGLEALLPKTGRKYRHDCVPVFIELNQFKSTQTHLTEMIRRELTACNFPDDFAEHALKNGKLLILLDGIEEVPAENLAHAIGEIRQLVQDYSSNRFITSCRIAFYQSWLPGFTDGFLAGLGDEQIRAYLVNWFQADGVRQIQKANEAWAKLSKPENAGVLELARRPLLLTFICLYYGKNFDLPVSFGQLYEEALAILLAKWAREKLPGGKPACGGLTAKQENHLLEEIAGPTFERDEFFFQKKILENQIDRFLRNELKASGIDGRDVLEAIEVQQGLLEARARNIYSFSHQTLHEYLASKQFHNQGLAIRLAERHFFERRYREVFLLLAEMEDASSMLLAAAKSLGRRIKEEKPFSKLVLWVSENYRTKSPREKHAERLNAQRDVALLMVHFSNLYTKMRNLPKPESYFQDPLSKRHDKYCGQWNEKWTTIADCLQGKDARDKEHLGYGFQDANELFLESFKLSAISRRIENATESIRNSEDTSFGSFLKKWTNRDTVDLESYFYGCNLLLECKTIAGLRAGEWEKIEENLVSFGI